MVVARVYPTAPTDKFIKRMTADKKLKKIAPRPFNYPAAG